jgi:antitoxin HicB
MDHYTYMILLVPEDDAYTVYVPALPGCVTCGESVEEAIEMAKDAISLWIEDMIDRGEDVPVESEPARTAIVTVVSPMIAGVSIGS